MQVHIHTKPQCNWLAHDPGCAALGAEANCILIEQGKNKGKYVCIHLSPDEVIQIETLLGYVPRLKVVQKRKKTTIKK